MGFAHNAHYEKLASDIDEHSTRLPSPTCQGESYRCHLLLIVLASFSAITAICSCLALTLVFWRKPESCFAHSDVTEPYSPATGHFMYENRWLVGDPDTPKFMGAPREELDEAWHDLLARTLIRVSADELRAANATSIPLKDGGYAAGLGVSHSLHCLKRIKQYFYKSYYYEHESQNWDELESHVNHCLESLRQTLLCQPDISLYTLEWTKHSRVKPAVRVPQAHACANFDMLHKWMNSRAGRIDHLVPPPDGFYEGHEYDEITGTIKGDYKHESTI